MSIDVDEKLLYIFGGDYNSFAISSESNRNEVSKYNTFQMKNVNTMYLPTPIQGIHIIGNQDHMSLDAKEQKVVALIETPGANLMHQTNYKSIYFQNNENNICIWCW